MSAPLPQQGSVNPYIGAYQTKQFDQGHAATAGVPYSGTTALDALANPPAAAVAAAAADLPNSKGQLPEATHPPVGAGGNSSNGGLW